MLAAEIPPMLYRFAPVLATATALFSMTAVAPRAAAPPAPWAGTWAAAAQPLMPGTLETFDQQTLRLIVHTSIAGSRVRIVLSNAYGTVPLQISNAHIAIRVTGANVEPRSNRALSFDGQPMVTIAAHHEVRSDPVDLQIPALADVAVSFFLPQKADATTSHLLALQTSYVAAGDAAGSAAFPVLRTIDTWPFLTGVEVSGPARLSSVVVIGSSTTDGDGSTQDRNRRLPDALAKRLQHAGGATAHVGVLNAGIIGNRLLKDSPAETGSPFGAGLGEAGLRRLDRDALDQPGVEFIIVALGVNDIAFPGSFTPADERVSAQSLIQGYRQLIERAHRKGIRVLMTTIPPFGNAIYPDDKTLVIHTPEKESVRREVNEWIRTTGEADGVADFDAALRDPAHPQRLLERFDSGDHLHANDEGYAASADAIPLRFFERRTQ